MGKVVGVMGSEVNTQTRMLNADQDFMARSKKSAASSPPTSQPQGTGGVIIGGGNCVINQDSFMHCSSSIIPPKQSEEQNPKGTTEAFRAIDQSAHVEGPIGRTSGDVLILNTDVQGIKTTTGDVTVSGSSSKPVKVAGNVSSNTGKVTLDNTEINGDVTIGRGNPNISNSAITGTLNVESPSGPVALRNVNVDTVKIGPLSSGSSSMAVTVQEGGFSGVMIAPEAKVGGDVIINGDKVTAPKQPSTANTGQAESKPTLVLDPASKVSQVEFYENAPGVVIVPKDFSVQRSDIKVINGTVQVSEN